MRHVESGELALPILSSAKPQVELEFRSWTQHSDDSVELQQRFRAVPSSAPRFTKATVYASGKIELTLHSGRKYTLDWSLTWTLDYHHTVAVGVQHADTARSAYFHAVGGSSLAGRRFRLQVAEFPDGSQIYVDSRGLLHLVSAVEELPEITLVSPTGHQESLTGWCSDGTWFGDPCFHYATVKNTCSTRSVFDRVTRSVHATHYPCDMPAWTLTVRYAREPQRKAAAWFIPGGQLADWWEELRGWGSLDDELRLLVLPHSRSDRSPRGLLVIGRRPESLPVSLRCRPYGCIGERFYLPIEARLEPALGAAELEELLPAAGRTFVFHPALGLVGFEPAECLRIQQLLAAPPHQPADWDRRSPALTSTIACCRSAPLKCPRPKKCWKRAATILATERMSFSSLRDLDRRPRRRSSRRQAGETPCRFG